MTDTTAYGLISAESHIVEPSNLFDGLPSEVRDRAPKLQPWNGGSAWMIDGADPVSLPASASGPSSRRQHGQTKAVIGFDEVLPGLYDPAERLALQDADSVDAEVLYPQPGLWDAIRQLDDDVQLACVRAYNDWISEFSAHNPGRLIGLGKIPATTRDDAHDEFVRCVKDLQLRGVLLDSWPGGGSVPAEPEDDEFWNVVNDSGVPVSVHFGIGESTSTVPPSGIAPGMTPPMASTVQPMLKTGLFDRCPNVRLVLAHGDAGWAYHWLEIMDATYMRRRHLPDFRFPFADPESLPSQYIRKHYWFTFHHDRSAIKNRHLLGPAHLMWASYVPSDTANWPDSREQAMRVTDEVPAEDRDRVLAQNTARLYRLPGFEDGFTAAEVESFEDLVHV